MAPLLARPPVSVQPYLGKEDLGVTAPDRKMKSYRFYLFEGRGDAPPRFFEEEIDQSEFQDPKLAVPNIYNAYIMPI
jgi:hypothetical protein